MSNLPVELKPEVGPPGSYGPPAKETNPKDALGVLKPYMSVLPNPPLYEAALGMLEGACRYGRHNYRVIGVRGSVYYDALRRHLDSWWEGEDTDHDSGIHHLAKALCCLLVLRDAMICGKHTDDRPPRAQYDWMKPVAWRTREILARFPDPKPAYTQAEQDAKARIDRRLVC